MEHTQVSCFEYDEETFKEILGFLPDTAADFKILLDTELKGCEDEEHFKKELMECYIHYFVARPDGRGPEKDSECWWCEWAVAWDDQPNYQEILEIITRKRVALWKLAVIVQHYSLDKQSVGQYAHERLVELEEQVKDNSINEQQYIDKCNRVVKLKNIFEPLMSACICGPIGSFNEDEDGEWKLRIVCLPCSWNTHATPVRFKSLKKEEEEEDELDQFMDQFI